MMAKVNKTNSLINSHLIKFGINLNDETLYKWYIQSQSLKFLILGQVEISTTKDIS